jgi:uncharacterized protein YcfL
MKTAILIFASMMFLAAGCTSSPKAPLNARNDPYRNEQVQYVDTDLRNDTAVGNIKLERDSSSGILYVTVPIRATTNKTRSIDYRVTFFDANGRPLDGANGWTAKTLNGNTFEYIKANSLTPEAKDFQMDLRFSK